jgi:hypothetical protein
MILLNGFADASVTLVLVVGKLRQVKGRAGGAALADVAEVAGLAATAAKAAAALEGTVYGEYRYAVSAGTPGLSMSNSP